MVLGAHRDAGTPRAMSGRNKRNNGQARGGTLQSVEEAAEQFPGQWILMKVTAVDEHNAPREGYVVSHTPYQSRACNGLAKAAFTAGHAGDRYYLFAGAPRAFSGTALRQVIAAAAAEDAPPSRGRP